MGLTVEYFVYKSLLIHFSIKVICSVSQKNIYPTQLESDTIKNKKYFIA